MDATPNDRGLPLKRIVAGAVFGCFWHMSSSPEALLLPSELIRITDPSFGDPSD